MAIARPQLFQYAIIWHPTEDQAKNGEKSKIILKPEYMLAATSEAVSMAAAMKIPQEHKDDLDQIQICVISF